MEHLQLLPFLVPPTKAKGEWWLIPGVVIAGVIVRMFVALFCSAGETIRVEIHGEHGFMTEPRQLLQRLTVVDAQREPAECGKVCLAGH